MAVRCDGYDWLAKNFQELLLFFVQIEVRNGFFGYIVFYSSYGQLPRWWLGVIQSGCKRMLVLIYLLAGFSKALVYCLPPLRGGLIFLGVVVVQFR